MTYPKNFHSLFYLFCCFFLISGSQTSTQQLLTISPETALSEQEGLTKLESEDNRKIQSISQFIDANINQFKTIFELLLKVIILPDENGTLKIGFPKNSYQDKQALEFEKLLAISYKIFNEQLSAEIKEIIVKHREMKIKEAEKERQIEEQEKAAIKAKELAAAKAVMNTYSWFKSSLGSVKSYISTPKVEEKENTAIETDPFEASVDGPQNLMKMINTKWALTVIQYFIKLHDGYVQKLHNSKIKNPLLGQLSENLIKVKSLSEKIKEHNFHLNFELDNPKTKDHSSRKVIYENLPRVLLVHEFEFMTRGIHQSWRTPSFCRLDKLEENLKVCKFFELMKCLVNNIEVTNTHDTIIHFPQAENEGEDGVFDDWLYSMDFGYYKDLQSMYSKFHKNIISKDKKQKDLKQKVQRAAFALPIINMVVQKCKKIFEMDQKKDEQKKDEHKKDKNKRDENFKLLLDTLTNLQIKLKENVLMLAKNNKFPVKNLREKVNKILPSLQDQRKLLNLNRQF